MPTKDPLLEIIRLREIKKAGRRCTQIAIKCKRSELESRILDLREQGFELDDDFPVRETGEGNNISQHVVVLHKAEKYEELISLPGISAHSPIFP